MSKKSRANKAVAATKDDTTAVAVAPAPVEEKAVETDIAVETIDNGDGSGATIMTLPDAAEDEPMVEISVTTTGGKQKIPMARVFIDADPTKGPMLLGRAVATVKSYVKGFMSLPVKARKGYDNYWAKADGFTNPVTIMKLTPQGIGKMMAILHHRAALYIADGGENATEMLNILKGISDYETVAVSEARIVAENKAMHDALSTIARAKGCTLEEARTFMAQFASQPMQTTRAAVVEGEPTIGESGATVEDDAEEMAEATTV